MKSISNKGFTLIEMIIVVIIIGILAAFLIPRFGAASGKANDAARKSHIRQISTALISYYTDTRRLPSEAYWVSTMLDALAKGGLSTIPYDPNGTEQFYGLTGTYGKRPYNTGDYAYTPIYKNGVKKGGFVVMAETETAGGSNWVVCRTGLYISGFNGNFASGGGDILSDTGNFKHILYCDKVLFSGTNDGDPLTPGYCKRATPTDGTCWYTDPEQLRYILKY